MRVPVYERGGFPANIVRAARSGSLPVIETEYAGGTTLPRHRHAGGSLIVVAAGSFDDLVGRSTRHYRRAAFFYRSSGQVHANRFETDVRCFNIELRAGDDHSSRSFESDTLLRALLDSDDELSLDSVVGEAMERLRERGKGSFASRRVVRARDLADDAFDTPLTLRSAAEAAGIAPAQLARDFRRAYGCTFGQYVRRKRIEFAVHALRDASRSLAEVSTAAGFYDQSHFTNAFRRVIGTTPARFRRGVDRQSLPRQHSSRALPSTDVHFTPSRRRAPHSDTAGNPLAALAVAASPFAGRQRDRLRVGARRLEGQSLSRRPLDRSGPRRDAGSFQPRRFLELQPALVAGREALVLDLGSRRADAGGRVDFAVKWR